MTKDSATRIGNIPDYTTHIDKYGALYRVTDEMVLVWIPERLIWSCLAFEPDEVKKYLDLHDIRSFKEWGNRL